MLETMIEHIQETIQKPILDNMVPIIPNNIQEAIQKLILDIMIQTI
jgi:hypothetical protein